MKAYRWALVAVAIVVILFGLVPVVLAENGDVPTFDMWLKAMSGPLVSAAASIVLSVLVEYWPAYEALQPKLKRLVFFGLCLILPLGAACLRGILGYAPWSFDPLIWQALWYGVSAGGIGTLAHTPKLRSD